MLCIEDYPNSFEFEIQSEIGSRAPTGAVFSGQLAASPAPASRKLPKQTRRHHNNQTAISRLEQIHQNRESRAP